jgi:hypothetical protein
MPSRPAARPGRGAFIIWQDCVGRTRSFEGETEVLRDLPVVVANVLLALAPGHTGRLSSGEIRDNHYLRARTTGTGVVTGVNGQITDPVNR